MRPGTSRTEPCSSSITSTITPIAPEHSRSCIASPQVGEQIIVTAFTESALLEPGAAG